MLKEACWVVGFGPTVVESPISGAKPRACRNPLQAHGGLSLSRCAFMAKVEEIYETPSRLAWTWYFLAFAIAAVGGAVASFVVLAVTR